MNSKRIIFSSIITGIAGVILGIGVAEINHADQRPNAMSQYATIGGVMGLAVGAGQQALRELEQVSEES
ncbi:hypothetical protein [Coleofasciculus chthonoplastes]|uniref:Uncharacterized protein n=1 Tax=Coleofasciculus chthonoplastes PCC 7420 TaxID=118168 RepID=B4VK02_9CYAN|nr:hypothetical protein [Coleofasciculus chthonoplastes]EDX77723.1 hypothetical protein MC7420_3047 [Coleofasciculus chthonoplastes PCC 7420]